MLPMIRNYKQQILFPKRQKKKNIDNITIMKIGDSAVMWPLDAEVLEYRLQNLSIKRPESNGNRPVRTNSQTFISRIWSEGVAPVLLLLQYLQYTEHPTPTPGNWRDCLALFIDSGQSRKHTQAVGTIYIVSSLTNDDCGSPEPHLYIVLFHFTDEFINLQM